MMDTQRIIALIVFSFSALLLWDAWQKHTAPKVAHTPASTIPSSPSRATPAASSAPAASTAPGAPAAAPGAPSQVPSASPGV
jgi:YidC/Oxa1 family membrane protein insertase